MRGDLVAAERVRMAAPDDEVVVLAPRPLEHAHYILRVDDDEAPGGAASVVEVVGLAHANPILERCAERGLLSSRERGGIDQEVARAIAERERAAALEPLAWEEYDRASR